MCLCLHVASFVVLVRIQQRPQKCKKEKNYLFIRCVQVPVIISENRGLWRGQASTSPFTNVDWSTSPRGSANAIRGTESNCQQFGFQADLFRLSISVRFDFQRFNRVDDCNFDLKLIVFDLFLIYFWLKDQFKSTKCRLIDQKWWYFNRNWSNLLQNWTNLTNFQ